MTVPDQENPQTEAIGNGVATVFDFDFLCLLSQDLRVSVDGAVIDPSEYAVGGLGEMQGGTVTFVNAPADGARILMELAVVPERQTDYQDNGDLFASTVNFDFDRLWLALQQAFSWMRRAITLPVEFPPRNSTVPPAAMRARKALIFDDTGNVTVGTDDYEDQAENAAESARQAAESAIQAGEARDEAQRIADEFGDLETAVDQAQAAAVSAQADAVSAAADADRAEAAAEVAQQVSRIYPDTATGIAATADGDYFYVPVPGSTDLLILYRHVGASAVEIGRYPSSLLITALGLKVTELERISADVERLGVNGWLLAHLDSVNAVIMGLKDTGVLVVPGGIDAPGVAQVVPTVDETLEGHTDQQGRLFSRWTLRGQRHQVMLDGSFKLIYDPQWITDLQEDVARLSGGAGAGLTSLQRMFQRCFNPFQDMNLCIFGDSEVWGVGASNTGSTEPHDWRLSDARANLTCRSWVNVLREFLGRKTLNIAIDAMPTEETAPGATSGGAGYFSQQQVAPFANSDHVHLYSSDGMELAQSTVVTQPPAVAADALVVPPGAYVEVEVLAASFDLSYATDAGSAEATFSVFADGALVTTQSFYSDTPSWGNVLPVAMPAYRMSTLHITNNASIELHLEGLAREKFVRVINQGISGTTSESWLPTPPTDRILLTAGIPEYCSDIFAALGTNDRVGSRVIPPNPTWHQRNMVQIIEWLKANRMRGSMTLSLICGYATLDELTVPKLYGQRDVARAQVELAKRYGIGVFNLYPQMRAAMDAGQQLFNPSDLLHMSDDGHTFIALDQIAAHCELNSAR